MLAHARSQKLQGDAQEESLLIWQTVVRSQTALVHMESVRFNIAHSDSRERASSLHHVVVTYLLRSLRPYRNDIGSICFPTD